MPVKTPLKEPWFEVEDIDVRNHKYFEKILHYRVKFLYYSKWEWIPFYDLNQATLSFYLQKRNEEQARDRSDRYRMRCLKRGFDMEDIEETIAAPRKIKKKGKR